MLAYVYISSESKWKKLVKMLDSNEGVIEGERHMLLYFFELWACEYITHSKVKQNKKIKSKDF